MREIKNAPWAPARRVGKKRPFGRSRLGWKVNIKTCKNVLHVVKVCTGFMAVNIGTSGGPL